MIRPGAALALVLVPAFALGCVDATYRCTADAQCIENGTQGTCEASRFCAFPDAMCPVSGRRYSAYASEGLAGACVVVSCSPSLLPNPDFEIDTHGWVGFYDSAAGVARSTLEAHGGQASAAVTPSGGHAYIGVAGTGLPVVVGQNYTGTWWSWVPTAGSYRALTMTDNGVDVGTVTKGPISANTWVKFTSVITISAWNQARQIVYRLDKMTSPTTFANTEIVYFDDLTLVAGTGPVCGAQAKEPAPPIPGEAGRNRFEP